VEHRVKVKEPPRNGDPRSARYHLKDDWELVGWTNDAEEASDWLKGFGPVTTANVDDRRSWVREPQPR
jgi:hypothetical protein